MKIETKGDAAETRVERTKQIYFRGATTVFASSFDARFSFGLYVPRLLSAEALEETTILVSVHGTLREQARYRDFFSEFAEYNHCIVLAPLFPCNVFGDGAMTGYKYILERDVRYDRVLIEMVDEARAFLNVRNPKFLLFGFSGGGQFAHRFALLQPERLQGVSIGAPGSVTNPVSGRPYWVGTADFEERFGRAFDPKRLEGLPIHLVIGADDAATWEITHRPGDPTYMEGANEAGASRQERLDTLARGFEACGAHVTVDRVDGVAHNSEHLVPFAKRFFIETLRAARAESGTSCL
ncbi:MAG: hypothetical protein MI723_18465 [Caulobacterales bacterium]|nr:hypothetical protein [Caulobacterales bacterium]